MYITAIGLAGAVAIVAAGAALLASLGDAMEVDSSSGASELEDVPGSDGSDAADEEDEEDEWDDDAPTVENKDYVEVKGAGLPTLDEQKKKMERLLALPNFDGRNDYTTCQKLVIDAVKDAFTVREDVAPFAINPNSTDPAEQTAKAAVEKCMALAGGIEPDPGYEYLSTEDEAVDLNNRSNILGTGGALYAVFLHMMTLLYMKGFAHLAVFKYDGKAKKGVGTYRERGSGTYSAILLKMPDLLEFTYCQGIAKKVLGDALLWNTRMPVSLKGKNLFLDVLNGSRVLVLTDDTRSAPKKTFYHNDSYVTKDRGTAISYLTPWNMATPGTAFNWKIGIDGDARSVGVHQVMLATCRHYMIHPAMAIHHHEGGCLAGLLDTSACIDNDSFWDKFQCKPLVGARSVSIIDGGKAPRVMGGEATGVGLTKGQLSRSCDGDHLFGRELNNNGALRVLACAHQENVVRIFVRQRSLDWLLAGLIGEYNGGDNMPTVQVARDFGARSSSGDCGPTGVFESV